MMYIGSCVGFEVVGLLDVCFYTLSSAEWKRCCSFTYKSIIEDCFHCGQPEVF
jgi:hypothetical protein